MVKRGGQTWHHRFCVTQFDLSWETAAVQQTSARPQHTDRTPNQSQNLFAVLHHSRCRQIAATTTAARLAQTMSHEERMQLLGRRATQAVRGSMDSMDLSPHSPAAQHAATAAAASLSSRPANTGAAGPGAATLCASIGERAARQHDQAAHTGGCGQGLGGPQHHLPPPPAVLHVRACQCSCV